MYNINIMKQNKKMIASFTISESINEAFTKISKENAINKSALIEILLTDWIRKFKIK